MTYDSHFTWGYKSQVWHGCLHGNTLWRWGLGLMLRVGLSKKLDPTLYTSPVGILAWAHQDPTLTITNLILMVSWSSKVGTWFPMLLELFMVWYNLYLSKCNMLLKSSPFGCFNLWVDPPINFWYTSNLWEICEFSVILECYVVILWWLKSNIYFLMSIFIIKCWIMKDIIKTTAIILS